MPVENVESEDVGAFRHFRATKVSSPFTAAVSVAELEDCRDNPANDANSAIKRTSDLLAYHYGLDLPPSHPCLNALTDLCWELSTIGVRVLVYATPINVVLGGTRLGEAFLATIRDRVSAARDATSAGGVSTFEDFHAICPSREFLHPDYVVEHLNQYGRHRLARRIVDRAKRLLDD